ncbi:5 -methylthioadenosine S-adenosylhomocysteine nucleosidase-like isoform X16 [Paramuricea clavata]|uniref:5 -methylthioadenosine S-adenosylhomocysteine nucleosidase-like isoform X16 n=1 Tax=Paramuricea clavata TaxID=317549 RepID=A0A7D9DFH1_PARCT|nr:5 -methylthioadenosine S-adenosylhomocysteine nucleosidase-like isoform X16 [Paramuricea clavata]
MSFKSDGYVETPPELNRTLQSLSNINSKPLSWSSKEIQSQLPIDILLITANKDAFIACYSYMKQVQRSSRWKLGMVYFGQFGDGSSQNLRVALMRRGNGSMESHKAVANGVEILRPKVALLVGICETLDLKTAKRGDVVISAKLEIYNMKFKSDNTIEYCGTRPNVGQGMTKLILSAADGWKPPLKDPKSFKVNVHLGALVLSGSNYIENRERLKELKKQIPDALVIENEEIVLLGLYPAAYDLEMEWAIVTGVSNLAGGSNLENVAGLWERFATVVAASIIHNMFKYSVVLEDWPHRRETGSNSNISE